MEQAQCFYKTGCEGVAFFALPAIKLRVEIPVIEVDLKKKGVE